MPIVTNSIQLDSNIIVNNITSNYKYHSKVWTTKYLSNFSVNDNGWFESRLVLTGNQDGIFGVDDCLAVAGNNTEGSHIMSKFVALTKDVFNRISFDYYIPSGLNINGLSIQNVDDITLPVFDSWTTYQSVPFFSLGTTLVFLTMKNSELTHFASSSDVIYLKNIHTESLL